MWKREKQGAASQPHPQHQAVTATGWGFDCPGQQEKMDPKPLIPSVFPSSRLKP